MSEQGFRGVPGVPEGWELVAIRKIKQGDYSINRVGDPFEWTTCESDTVWPIIRKIEKPAKYRPFANAEEFKAHPLSGGWVLLGAGVWGRVLSFSDDYVSTSDTHPDEYTWGDAFSDLLFDDGTPFGVKIDE
jgi:hypothetical protein